jgi:hypothetical protein
MLLRAWLSHHDARRTFDDFANDCRLIEAVCTQKRHDPIRAGRIARDKKTARCLWVGQQRLCDGRQTVTERDVGTMKDKMNDTPFLAADDVFFITAANQFSCPTLLSQSATCSVVPPNTEMAIA